MPRKQTQKPAEESKQTRKVAETPEVQVPVQAQAQAQVPAQVPVKAPRQRKNQKQQEQQTTVQTAETENTTTSTETKTRRFATRESVEAEFDSLVLSIEEEINRLRENSAGKAKGVRFLRTVNKRIKSLRTHALRVSKQKSTTRRNNSNSGFLKPVQISKDLAKFTGWDQSQLRSRVDVTKFICEYIKQHNLQDPEDKRKIRVENDQNLKKLLRFDGKDGKPLTYYSLQTYLKSHFTPTSNTTSASTATKA